MTTTKRILTIILALTLAIGRVTVAGASTVQINSLFSANVFVMADNQWVAQDRANAIDSTEARALQSLFNRFFRNDVVGLHIAQSTAQIAIRPIAGVDLAAVLYNAQANTYRTLELIRVCANGFSIFEIPQSAEFPVSVVVSNGTLVPGARPQPASLTTATTNRDRDRDSGSSNDSGSWTPPAPPEPPPPPQNPTITMTNDGNGTAIANPTTAAVGTEITITATPSSADYQFLRWVVVRGGVTLSPNENANPATFTMSSNDVEISAEFERTPLGNLNHDADRIDGSTLPTQHLTGVIQGPTIDLSPLSDGVYISNVTLTSSTATGLVWLIDHTIQNAAVTLYIASVGPTNFHGDYVFSITLASTGSSETRTVQVTVILPNP